MCSPFSASRHVWATSSKAMPPAIPKVCQRGSPYAVLPADVQRVVEYKLRNLETDAVFA